MDQNLCRIQKIIIDFTSKYFIHIKNAAQLHNTMSHFFMLFCLHTYPTLLTYKDLLQIEKRAKSMFINISQKINVIRRGRCCHDHMVVGFTTTYAISAYHHYVVSSNLEQGKVHNIM